MLQSNMLAMMSGLMCGLYNLTNALTHYICCSPVTTLVFYCLTYCSIICYVASLQTIFTRIAEETHQERRLPIAPTKDRYQIYIYKYMLQGVMRGKYKHTYWRSHYSPIKPRSQDKTWFGQHEWTPLLSEDFSADFEEGYNYTHYVNATRDILEGIEPYRDKHKCGSCYTVITDDIFLSTGYCAYSEHMDIIFYSRCTTSVTVHREDFIGEVKVVNKIILGLSSTAKVAGEGIVKWTLRDDFGVEQKIEVNALLVPTSKVILFSPQSYFEQVQ